MALALTRSKRGRSPKNIHGKSNRKSKHIASKVQSNVSPRVFDDKDKESEIGVETRKDTELFVHKSRAAAMVRTGTTTVKAAGTAGEQDVELGGRSTVERDEDSDISSASDSFPQFVIDSKPDLRLDMDSSDIEDDKEESDVEFQSHDEMNFVIDKVGSSAKFNNNREQIETNVTVTETKSDEHLDTDNSSVSKKSNKKLILKNKISEKKSLLSLEAPCEIDAGLDLGDCYINLDGEDSMSSKMAVENILLNSQQDQLIKKSVLTPDFEKKHSIPPYKVGIRQLKKQRQKERESTKGDGWFNMKAPEMTEELRNDIKIVRMRSTLDPKRFYKGNDMTAIPKFVQIGTVVDNPVDFYHSRVPKKHRKQTLVDELLADSDTRRYNKRKYLELQERFNSVPKGGKKRKFGKKMDGRKR